MCSTVRRLRRRDHRVARRRRGSGSLQVACGILRERVFPCWRDVCWQPALAAALLTYSFVCKEHRMRGYRPRSHGWLATVFMVAITLMAPWPALAQDATPQVSGEAVQSPTREEFTTQLVEDIGYTEAETPGGTFIDSNTSDIQTVHPFLAEEETSIGVVGLIFEQLVGGDVRTGQPAPTGLADSWEIASDGVTYTFHLNKNAKWHDGVDVTAADVQFSFDALANPDTGSVYTGTFLDTVESWRAVNDDTFEVVAQEPLYTFLYDVVAFIVPKHIWEGVPVAEWRNDPGATGA